MTFLEELPVVCACLHRWLCRSGRATILCHLPASASAGNKRARARARTPPSAVRFKNFPASYACAPTSNKTACRCERSSRRRPATFKPCSRPWSASLPRGRGRRGRRRREATVRARNNKIRQSSAQDNMKCFARNLRTRAAALLLLLLLVFPCRHRRMQYSHTALPS